jgi:hypothetical protein
MHDDASCWHPGFPEAPIEFDCEVHVRRLRLPVRSPGRITSDEMKIVRVDRSSDMTPRAGNGDNASAGTAEQRRQ